MEIINPATGKIITTINSDTEESIHTKLKDLRQGQSAWAQRSIKNRLDCIEKFGELVQQNLEELAKILTQETGKPIQQSRNEIKGAHNRIEHLVRYAKSWLSEEILVDSGATHEKIIYEPLGVIANISAWNFPYNVGYNVFLYALVAGNAVLYKPSEYAALTGKQFQKYLHLAGVPTSVFQCVLGGGEVGQLLLESDLDGYFFTGSHKTGVHIAKSVAHKLVPVQLELGGKDPLYVTDDVKNIKQAAINAAEGAFYNNGQSCCAVERIYVSAGIYDEFVDALVAEVDSYKIGDPTEPGTFIGPLTRKQQIEILDEQVADAVAKGATVKLGGQASAKWDGYYNPTVLIDCGHHMRVMQEESFGPIIGIQEVASDEEAIALMQDTEYGLTAAVFSANEERAMGILKKMDTGTVYWNCCDRVSPNIPWSGRKNSGIGSTLSSQGIRAFVQPKAYHLRA